MSWHNFELFFLGYECNSAWIALIRILLCGWVIAAFSTILLDAWDFSKPNGIFSGENYILFSKEKFAQISVFNIFPNSRIAHVLMFILFYASGLFAMLGLFTEFSLFVFLVCVISFQSRLAPIMCSAADAVLRTMLLCLFLTDCGAAWSLDVVWGWNDGNVVVNGWAIRVFQFFICLVYLGSAMPKLHDKYWLNGDVVRNAVLSGIWGKRIAINFIKKNTRILTVCALFYEYFAPLLLLFDKTTLIAVIAGMFLHGGIAVFMRVGCFGPLMCIALLSFLNPK